MVGIQPQGTAGDPPSSPDVYSSRSLMPLGGGRGDDSSPALGSSSSDNSGPLLQRAGREGGRGGERGKVHVHGPLQNGTGTLP